MHNLHVVIGPPGTGKTHYVGKQVQRAVDTHGLKSTMVCSLTKTAAREAAGRTGLPRDCVGTLHSFAYRSLGSPDIAETHIDEWNDEYPRWEMKVTNKDVDDLSESAHLANGMGEVEYQNMSLRRARCEPSERWPMLTQAFFEDWSAWKEKHGYADFTDMIEIAIEECPQAPGNPRNIFFDEAQDASALEVQLLKRWSRGADTIVMVGDPYQALYTWRGADPSTVFPEEIPPRVLTQSYRVPIAVHSAAIEWLENMPGYVPIEYKPTEDPGHVNRSAINYRNFAKLLGDIDEDLTQGRSVMVLATCAYMIKPIVATLRRAGLPFHNPWRRKKGEWNPLNPAAGVRMCDRLAAFVQADSANCEPSLHWTGADLKAWADVLNCRGVFLRGAKQRLEIVKDDEIFPLSRLSEFFEPQAIEKILDVDASWWFDNLNAKKGKSAIFPFEIYQARGYHALIEQPQIIVGTIHSLKGAEADSVYMFPDLSVAGYREWHGSPAQRANVYRTFYVGYTRAKHKVTLCASSNALTVSFI